MFYRVFYAVLIVCMMLLMPHNGAYAEQDLEQVYLKEAQEYAKQCQDDGTLPLYFNCECMAAQYLRVRKELGPDAAPSVVKAYLGAECKDGTGIARVSKEECLEQVMFQPKGIDPKVFCTCYAHKFSKAFEDLQGAMSARAEIALKSMARTKCTDPEAARRIYGSR